MLDEIYELTDEDLHALVLAVAANADRMAVFTPDEKMFEAYSRASEGMYAVASQLVKDVGIEAV